MPIAKLSLSSVEVQDGQTSQRDDILSEVVAECTVDTEDPAESQGGHHIGDIATTIVKDSASEINMVPGITLNDAEFSDGSNEQDDDWGDIVEAELENLESLETTGTQSAESVEDLQSLKMNVIDKSHLTGPRTPKESNQYAAIMKELPKESAVLSYLERKTSASIKPATNPSRVIISSPSNDLDRSTTQGASTSLDDGGDLRQSRNDTILGEEQNTEVKAQESPIARDSLHSLSTETTLKSPLTEDSPTINPTTTVAPELKERACPQVVAASPSFSNTISSTPDPADIWGSHQDEVSSPRNQQQLSVIEESSTVYSILNGLSSLSYMLP
ncbi:hypothetical protein BT63DRAFT_166842 [Microthyrium microscopicum]|uniref:Uncharacterized protein n=1 Tax=Microthyrium microscopicum TaxID=703497 RepID=A0A6A6URU0_9PEZI|nr:hypothetical protein BT63DRAFT_166842 [Microthyrium microscopicum]